MLLKNFARILIFTLALFLPLAAFAQESQPELGQLPFQEMPPDALYQPPSEPGILMNSFGYVSFEPFQMVVPDGGKPSFYAGSGVPWGDESKISLMFQLIDPGWRFGGNIALEKEYADQFTPRIINTASVWIRPFGFLRLEVGTFDFSDYQGRYNPGDFIQYIGPAEEYENTIFQRLKGQNGTGVLISVTPIEPLFLGALVNPLLGARADNYSLQPATAKQIYENGQYMAAYTFANVGIARVQYIGGSNSRPNLASRDMGAETRHTVYQLKIKQFEIDKNDYSNWLNTVWHPAHPGVDPEELPENDPLRQTPGFLDRPVMETIPVEVPVYNPYYNAYPFTVENLSYLQNPMSLQAAFAYTAIKNLTIDAGFTYPIYIADDYGKSQRPLKFSVAATYSGSRFAISGRVAASFGGWSEFRQPTDIIYEGLLRDPDDDPESPDSGYASPDPFGQDDSYSAEPVGYYINNYSAIDYGMTFDFGLTASYSFGFGTVGLEFAMKFGAKDTVTLKNPYAVPDAKYNPEYDNSRFSVGFGAWVMKTLGAASIKVGFALSPPAKNANTRLLNPEQNPVFTAFNFDNYEQGPLVFTIPIVFGYWL